MVCYYIQFTHTSTCICIYTYMYIHVHVYTLYFKYSLHMFKETCHDIIITLIELPICIVYTCSIHAQ